MPVDTSKLKFEDHIGLWANELRAWVPDAIFDAHVHLGPIEAMGPFCDERLKEPLSTFADFTWEQLLDWYRQLYSGKRVAGLIAFGIPVREVNLELANDYIARIVRANPNVKGFIVSDPKDTRKTINQYKLASKRGIRFSGVKPYSDLLCKSNYQATIPEFVPKDLLEFMDSEGLVMMLHTSGLGMCEVVNQNFIKSVATYYPNIKIILAHMGRYLEAEQFMKFMASDVMDCPTVFLETSSASRPEVYERVLQKKELWGRLIFGSDIPFGLITGEEYWSEETGPVFLTRDDYTWSNPELNKKLSDVRRRMTYNTYHTIKAIKTAIDQLKISPETTAKLKNMIFLDNARLGIFG
jgi:predicted TIM-barrel fold metal-dependent hydrolase